MTITANTTLTTDLDGCEGIGIIVGGDGIRLDLGGHTVKGDGVGDFEGINVINHHSVSISNGTVTDFVEGIALIGVHDLSVSSLQLSNHRHVGVFVSDSANVAVEATTSNGIAFSGIFVTRSQRVEITKNAVSDGGAGIGVRVSDHVHVAGNRVKDIDCGGIAFEGGTDSVVESNVLTGRNGCDGIELFDASDRNVIRQNIVEGAGGGLGIAYSSHNVMSNNQAARNRFVGAYVFGDSVDNVLDNNGFIRNGDGSEGGVHLVADGSQAPRRSVIVGGSAINNRGDGVLVDALAAGTVVREVVATGNTDDGIDIDAPETSLFRNRANGNGDLGIEAVVGTNDGGGNSAHGNRNPAQCEDVVCR